MFKTDKTDVTSKADNISKDNGIQTERSSLFQDLASGRLTNVWDILVSQRMRQHVGARMGATIYFTHSTYKWHATWQDHYWETKYKLYGTRWRLSLKTPYSACSSNWVEFVSRVKCCIVRNRIIRYETELELTMNNMNDRIIQSSINHKQRIEKLGGRECNKMTNHI